MKGYKKSNNSSSFEQGSKYPMIITEGEDFEQVRHQEISI